MNGPVRRLIAYGCSRFRGFDRPIMTQDDIGNGRLICVIGIAPVKPADVVIFRTKQKTNNFPQTRQPNHGRYW